MKKILVPIDFSTGSLNAYEYALAFAYVIGAKVTLLHVYGVGDKDKKKPRSLVESLAKNDEEASLSALEGYGYSVQQDLGVEVPSTYILEKGQAVKSIVEYADFMEADLIVMGTWWAKGASGAVEVWTGSVGTKVIRKTARPVLLVPENARYKKVVHMAYATNFREKDQKIPREILDLYGTDGLSLFCVHVHRPEVDYSPIKYSLLEQLYKIEAEIDGLEISFYALRNEDIVDGLREFMEREKVDIMAVLAHKDLTVLERVLGLDIPKRIAFHTKVPLLVMHQDQ